MGKSQSQGSCWNTPGDRIPCWLCQEIFKSIWRYLHVQLSHEQQGAGVTDLWGEQVSILRAVLTTLSMCISSIRPTTVCSVVKDTSTVTSTNKLVATDGFKSIWRHLHAQFSHVQQVSFFLPRVEVTLKLCITSDCCRLLCRIVSPTQTVLSTSDGKSPQISEADKTRLEIQDWLQMSVICEKSSSAYQL